LDVEYVIFGGVNTDLEKGLTKDQAISAAIRYALSGQDVCVEIHPENGELRYLNPDGTIGDCGRVWTRETLPANTAG
jgi:hypothetical protein